MGRMVRRDGGRTGRRDEGDSPGNTDARNEVRFEGPGSFAATVPGAPSPTTVRGHLHEAGQANHGKRRLSATRCFTFKRG